MCPFAELAATECAEDAGGGGDGTVGRFITNSSLRVTTPKYPWVPTGDENPRAK